MKEINNHIMLEPIILQPTPANLRIRLQSPSLMAPKQGEIIERIVSGDGWDLQSGNVLAQVRLSKQGYDYFEIKANITNYGDKTEEVRFSYPYLFYHFDYQGRARVFDPIFGGILEAKNSPILVHYPGSGSFCLTGATVPGSAIGIGVYNPEQRHFLIRHYPALNDGSMRFTLDRVEVKAGETLELPVSFIKIGDNWGEAFAPYRDWIAATYKRPRTLPSWFVDEGYTETRKGHCASYFAPLASAEEIGIWMFDNEGAICTLDHLKKEIDEALETYAIRGLKPLFYQFGWWKAMDDLQGVFPFEIVIGDYTEPNQLIKESIRYIHEKGARVYLYTNSISFGDESQIIHQTPSLLIRDSQGQPIYNSVYPLYLLCPGAPGMKEYWERVVQYMIVELDADGIFLDQAGGGFPPQYCYDPEHHHEHPDTYGADFIKMMDHVAHCVRAVKPDGVVVGELCHEIRSLYLDETHGRNYGFGMRNFIPETAEERRDTEPTEYYAFLKYFSPEIRSQTESIEHVMDGSPGYGDQTYYTSHRSIFDYGFEPCKTEYPGVIAYLFGDPQSEQAILAVRCHTPLHEVKVFLPRQLQPITGLDTGAQSADNACITVDVDDKPKYYLLQREL